MFEEEVKKETFEHDSGQYSSFQKKKLFLTNAFNNLDGDGTTGLQKLERYINKYGMADVYCMKSKDSRHLWINRLIKLLANTSLESSQKSILKIFYFITRMYKDTQDLDVLTYPEYYQILSQYINEEDVETTNYVLNLLGLIEVNRSSKAYIPLNQDFPPPSIFQHEILTIIGKLDPNIFEIGNIVYASIFSLSYIDETILNLFVPMLKSTNQVNIGFCLRSFASLHENQIIDEYRSQAVSLLPTLLNPELSIDLLCSVMEFVQTIQIISIEIIHKIFFLLEIPNNIILTRVVKVLTQEENMVLLIDNLPDDSYQFLLNLLFDAQFINKISAVTILDYFMSSFHYDDLSLIGMMMDLLSESSTAKHAANILLDLWSNYQTKGQEYAFIEEISQFKEQFESIRAINQSNYLDFLDNIFNE